jgi:hypothetical protein
MGRPKHTVRLTTEERKELEKLVSTGKTNAQKITHARILLKVDADGPNCRMSRFRKPLMLENQQLSVSEKRL